MSRLVEKPTMWFPNRSDTNRPVQAQKRDRNLKFRKYVEEELYYSSSENKGADQLRSYCEADLRLCFRICRLLAFQWDDSFVNVLVTIQWDGVVAIIIIVVVVVLVAFVIVITSVYRVCRSRFCFLCRNRQRTMVVF